MYQYVGLLELVCSSGTTTEVLQDVSVIYARLGEGGGGGAGDHVCSSGPTGGSQSCDHLKVQFKQ